MIIYCALVSLMLLIIGQSCLISGEKELRGIGVLAIFFALYTTMVPLIIYLLK